VDLEAGELLIVRSLIVRGGQLLEKDTKTHAARRIALLTTASPCLTSTGAAPGNGCRRAAPC
jgi:hypothetical protein